MNIREFINLVCGVKGEPYYFIDNKTYIELDTLLDKEINRDNIEELIITINDLKLEYEKGRNV